MRYEEGFSEPETGLPYGNWMRVNIEARRLMGSSGGILKLMNPWGREERGIQSTKKGSDVFAFKAAGGTVSKAKENMQPNMQLGGGWGTKKDLCGSS